LRTICIGDIHGCIAEFQKLVEVLAPTSEDRIVLLGDLIDKGPKSAEVVRFAREIGATTIQGNHEEKALRWFAHEKTRIATGKANPMSPPEHKVREWNTIPADDREWLAAAPVYTDLGSGFLAVHGGMLPGVKPQDHKKGIPLRLRFVNDKGKFLPLDDDHGDPEGGIPWYQVYDGEHSLVVGHTVHSLEYPRMDRIGDRVIWHLDTGCVHGGRLTALILETQEVVQVQASQVYKARD
jgi:hypothetical protein